MIIESLDKASADDVDDGAVFKNELSVGSSLLGEIGRKVAVLNDSESTIHNSKVADFFVGAAFGDGLGGHFRATVCMQADKERINHHDKGVVHLEIADVLNASSRHVFDGTAVIEGSERTTMAIG